MSGLNPITRREVFLAAASGDQVETPEPITREEMYLKKIAEGGGGSDLPDTPAEDGTYALQNTVSSGTGTLSWASGGSSGGGVLVVHNDNSMTLDKTWQEIHDAVESGKIVIIDDDGAISYVTLVRDAAHAETVPGKYSVESVQTYFNGWDAEDWAFNVMLYGCVHVCDTANDYPSQYAPNE